jgi:hypothetical protein
MGVLAVLYDNEIRDALSRALRDGYAGDGLKLRVVKQFEIDAMSPAQYKLFDESFRRLVLPAAKTAKPKAEKSGKLF